MQASFWSPGGARKSTLLGDFAFATTFAAVAFMLAAYRVASKLNFASQCFRFGVSYMLFLAEIELYFRELEIDLAA